jgi:hypothetical protein
MERPLTIGLRPIRPMTAQRAPSSSGWSRRLRPAGERRATTTESGEAFRGASQALDFTRVEPAPPSDDELLDGVSMCVGVTEEPGLSVGGSVGVADPLDEGH